ncbi:hypothetical protein [Mesorhizobium sp. M7A.F.Ca.US.008.03.1.1]|uniref:hypothetical protein n=1 Tax=Mesorhizobium sp. M7A.F.Ca.US.008.03.1.1 TaxID=2496742 RepID=UPI000FCB47AF|nr:hypothetical protein [Mesorhizobium sp. M7A.F.Ca.US.008.03.1.1]RUW58750.1 hypothetical protein EOA16_26065 [Mesorhizobium sp. M7A.F.Ca.US.008.03.1.1]
MHPFLLPVQLKLDRATLRANSLLEIPKTLGLGVVGRTELLAERKGFRLIVDDIPHFKSLDDACLDLSEYVHMLRSALDNLAFALARLKLDPPAMPGAIHFPIQETEAAFSDKRITNCLSQMEPQAAEKITQVQPFQRGKHPEIGADGKPSDDPLLVLQKLSNIDKHRVPAVALLGQVKQDHSHTVEFYSEDDASANVPPDTTVAVDPLRPGLVVMEYRTNCPIKSATGQWAVEARLMVSVDGGWLPFEQTVGQLVWYANLVADQFRPFFKGEV